MSETVERVTLCHYTGRAGHFTFGWSRASDEKAAELIQQKMDEGVVFRILPTGPFGRAGAEPIELTRLEDITDDRKLLIDDDDIEAFLASEGGLAPDTAELSEEASEQAPPMARARTPREVLENDTIAHRPLTGG